MTRSGRHHWKDENIRNFTWVSFYGTFTAKGFHFRPIPPLQGACSEELENVIDVIGSVQKELPENSAETPQLCLTKLIPLKPTIKLGKALAQLGRTLA